MRRHKLTLFLAVGMACLCFSFPGSVFGDAKPGDIINATNIEQYKDYLPFFIQGFVKDGWGLAEPVTIHVKGFTENSPPRMFMAAGEKHKDGVKLLPDGALQGYVSGFPFPDPKEPDIAQKIMWNVYYRWRGDDYMYPGGFPVSSRRKGGRITSADALISQVNFTNRTVVDPKPNLRNPKKLHWAMTLDSMTPPNKDMVTLVWRYADPTKQDDMWTYLPTIRRTLRLVSSERANPVRGTPTTWDDFFGFDGKPLAFTYQLLRQQEMLGLMNQQTFGDTFPKGYPHPVISGPNDPFELRNTFVVDVRSKDPRYPESKRIMWIPTDIFYPLYGQTYDKAGKLWKGSCDGFAKAKTETGDTGPWLTEASYTDFKTGYWTQNLLNKLKIDSGLDLEQFDPSMLSQIH